MRIKLNRLAFLFSGIRSVEFLNDGVRVQHVLREKKVAYPITVHVKLTYMRHAGWYLDRIDLGILQLSWLNKDLAAQILKAYHQAVKRHWQMTYHDEIELFTALSANWFQWCQQQVGFLRHDQLMPLDASFCESVAQLPWAEFEIELPAYFEQFREYCANPERWRYRFNLQWQQQQLRQYQWLFIELEKHPLTDLQQLACVTDERQVLVLAGAGTGKTSTLVAKTCYLLKSCQASADKIMLLAFGKDAQQELSQRFAELDYASGVKVQTFHSIAKSIIESYQQTSARVAEWVNNEQYLSEFFQHKMCALCDEPLYGKVFIQYVQHYLYSPTQLEQLKQQGKKIKSFGGDWLMPGPDLLLLNGLFVQGIEYRYQQNYAKQGEYFLPQFSLVMYWEGHIQPDALHCLALEPQAFTQKGMPYVLELLQNYAQQNQLPVDKLINPIPAYTLFDQLQQSGYLQGLLKMCCDFIALYKGRLEGMKPLASLCPRLESAEDVRLLGFVRLMQPLWDAYHQVLEAEGQIDFNDMLHQALALLQKPDFMQRTEGHFLFDYFLVDEFQDISPLRAALLKGLQHLNERANIFAVGDDWQAIYRFAGSDVNLTLQFETHFGHCEQVVLDKTFRFNNRINQVATRFIQQNPQQLPKNLTTHTEVKEPRVHLIKGESAVSLQYILQQIQHKYGSEKRFTVLILARFYRSAPLGLKKLQQQFSNLQLSFKTVHKSKGCQADFVIVLDVNEGPLGFPAQRENDPILQRLLPTPEAFPYAEERRLFYVALTRALHHVYIQSDAPSAFVKEIESYKDWITLTRL